MSAVWSELCAGIFPADGRGDGARLAMGDILLERRRKAPFCGLSIEEFEREWVTAIPGGEVYLPAFCDLIHTLRHDLLGPPLGTFKEMAFPRLLSRDIAARFGLVAAWPHILFAVQALSTSSEQRAASEVPGLYVLDPVQCAPAYAWLAQRLLTASDLPVLVRESLGGWSYRNERLSQIAVVKKATQFLRNEYVAVGTGAHVREIRRRIIEFFSEYLEAHDLHYRIVVGSGCFASKRDELEGKLVGLRDPIDIPVLDVELLLPQTGEWMEVLGASLWGTKLTSAFGIRCPSAEVESGCTGIGISRLAYAMLMQGGVKEDSTPDRSG